MGFLPVPSQSNVQQALRSFLLSFLPSNWEVISAHDNRVPEPPGPDFIVMTTIRRERLETNTDSYVDCSFIASMSGTTMTVTSMLIGSITLGNNLLGVGILPGTTISSQISGTPGKAGSYTLSAGQSLASAKFACGAEVLLQPTHVVVQCDVHSANFTDSSDAAQTITTLMRDDYAFQQFLASGFNVAPLHADDPKMVPFENAEQQYETRWIVDVHLQANQAINPSQQFADQLKVTGVFEVDTGYPL